MRFENFLFKFAVISMLMLANPAYASGDPAVLYYLGGALFLHLILLIWLISWFMKNKQKRWVVLTYPVVLSLCWYWIWNTQIESKILFVFVLYGFPVLNIIFIRCIKSGK